jgi:tRNA nucleotidyltransferase (CCA-adding enzyme)
MKSTSMICSEITARAYLVGGAVRDELLGLDSQDRDWVVVGVSEADMLSAGFTRVGADFPVFLHPHTQEEYALARTERKTGRGYAGFSFDTRASVTLEADLKRRDLTINAIAKAGDGTLVDPCGGVDDLRRGVLRHASPAFVEDPVRVLRIARFLARYRHRHFEIAQETYELMRAQVQAGELEHLVPERVFEELRKTLREPTPSAFLRALRECGALRVVFPELDALYGVPQRAEFHPEICTGLHQEMVSDAAARLYPAHEKIGFCSLLHDLGKARTPADVLPRHLHHESAGLAPVQQFCKRLRVPSEWARLAELTCVEHLSIHRVHELRAGTIVELLMRIDVLRKPERLSLITSACHADKAGRLGLGDAQYPQAELLQACATAMRQVDTQALLEKGLQGQAFAKAIKDARCRGVADVLKDALHT